MSVAPGLVPTAVAQGPQALRRDSLQVVYWPGQRPLAERTLRAAATPLRLPGIPGPGVRVGGTVLLAPDPASFDSLTGGVAPGWSAGVAFPASRVIVLPAFPSSRTPNADPITALRHEVVHLALNAYLPGRIPRWFDEGYATWASGEWDEGAGWQLRLALLRGAAPPLDSLSLEWPARHTDARLAYLLSASAVRFLAERGGESALGALFAAWRRDGSFDAALRSVYQITPSQFERQWRDMIRSRYGWLLAISQIGVFWGVVTLLFLVLALIRRRRDRVKLDALRAEEYMLPASTGEAGVDDEWRPE